MYPAGTVGVAAEVPVVEQAMGTDWSLAFCGVPAVVDVIEVLGVVGTPKL
jgi:hypothetical protein